MKRFVSIFLFIIFFVISGKAQSMTVHPTKYDWSELASSVTKNASSPREKAYAIYRWLCDNIGYDTSYSIHDADSAIEKHIGVCQAYCEIFYQIGAAIGLKVDIIGGKSKDHDGNIGNIGHAWVFVYTDGNRGILIDPTWGAGSVKDGVFTRSKNDDSWFDVSPEWLIFTHYPDEEVYQLMQRKISMSEFASIPSFSPDLEKFGFNSETLLNDALAGKQIDIPTCYSSALGSHKIGKAPLEGTLRVGQRYEFVMRPQYQSKFMIHNGNDYFTEWQNANGYIYCTFVPSEGNKPLLVSVSENNGNGSKEEWDVIMKYKVAKPTSSDIANLESLHPEKSPVFKDVENYNADMLKALKIDIASLLKEVKANRIKKLPIFYDKVKYRIADIPWDGNLKVGSPIKFRIAPLEGENWVIINGENWYHDWTQPNPGDPWEITITPTTRGKLKIAASLPSDPDSYWPCIEYEVD